MHLVSIRFGRIPPPPQKKASSQDMYPLSLVGSMEQLDSHWEDFCEILYGGFLRKFLHHLHVFLGLGFFRFFLV